MQRTRDQIAKIHWIIKKTRGFQKNIYLCLVDYAKAIDCVDHNKLWKNLKRWENQTTWLASWEICVQVKKLQLELEMEKQPLALDGKGLLLQRGSYCLLNEQMSDDPCLFSSSLLVSALILPVLLGQINLKHSLCPFLLLSPDLQWLLIGCWIMVKLFSLASSNLCSLSL